MADYTNISWESFSISSKEFAEAIETECLDRLLYSYFTDNQFLNSQFLTELSDKFPTELMKSIRTSQSIFNDVHFESLQFLQHHANPYLRAHFKVFSKLAALEKERYDAFVQSFKKTLNIDIVEVMTVASLWFEKVRATLFETGEAAVQYDLNPKIEVINFFLTHYLFEKRAHLETIILPEFGDLTGFAAIVSKYPSEDSVSKHPVWLSMEEADIYMYYLNGTFEAYCFDMNYDVTVTNGVVETKFKDLTKWNNWYKNETKIAYWYNYYRTLATESVLKKMSEEPGFIKNRTGFDFDMNLEGNIRSANAFMVARDYCLDESSLNGASNISLIKFLTGFVSNAYGRFVMPVDELNEMNPYKWLTNICAVFEHYGRKEIGASPLRLVKKSEFMSLAVENLASSEKSASALVSLVSFDITKAKFLNRLSPMVNLVSKPFLKIGEHYLAFNGILGESNSQVNLLMNIMEGNSKAHRVVEQKEVNKLEKWILSLFNEADFTNALCSLKYKYGSVEGDLDIVVYHSGVLLLIELKRSKIRTTLSDIHNEYENSLIKASKQLDKARCFIENQFFVIKERLSIPENDVKQLKIYSFIVSTSFEYDHELIRDKHFKFSLFELQQVLASNITQVSENKLESLIQHILSNRYWERLTGDAIVPDADNWTLRFD